MPTTIKLKNSVTTTNAPSSLAQGEVAINITDKKVWVGNAATTPIQLLGAGSSASFGALTCTSLTNSGLTSGRVTYATTAGLLTDSANLTFNGTTLTVTDFTDSSLTAGRVVFPTTGGNLSGSANLFWDNTNGFLGIGTASPAQKLQIGTSTANDYIQIGATNLGYVLGRENATGEFLFNATQASPYNVFKWQQGGTERMRISASGDVGIGTSSPSAKLQVVGNVMAGNGTAATPAYHFVGSSAIGMFTPDAGFSVAFSTGSTERMRIDSSGNVGIGTSSPTRRLHLYASATCDMTIQAGNATDYSYLYFGDSASATQGWIGYYHTEDSMRFATNAAERMRITSSGDVFVGGTSAVDNNKFQIYGAKSLNAGIPQGQLNIADTSAIATGVGGAISFSALYSGGSYTTMGSISGVRENGTSGNYAGALIFNTRTNGGNNDERMRITSGGNLLVGDNTVTGVRLSSIAAASNHAGLFNSQTAGWASIVVVNSGTPTVDFIAFRTTNGGANVGSITYNGSATAYNTSSDYRLKENIVPMTGALATVAQLKPVTYKWKSDGSNGQGFIAHELQEVVPDCVTGEKDAIDANGNIKPQGVDTSFLVATLTAAIQEQQAMIEELKQEVAKLKGV